MDDCDRTGEGGEEISSSSSDNGDIGRQGLLKTSSSFGQTGLPEKKNNNKKKKTSTTTSEKFKLTLQLPEVIHM